MDFPMFVFAVDGVVRIFSGLQQACLCQYSWFEAGVQRIDELKYSDVASSTLLERWRFWCFSTLRVGSSSSTPLAHLRLLESELYKTQQLILFLEGPQEFERASQYREYEPLRYK
jgi:hypothetical protein